MREHFFWQLSSRKESELAKIMPGNHAFSLFGMDLNSALPQKDNRRYHITARHVWLSFNHVADSVAMLATKPLMVQAAFFFQSCYDTMV